MTTWNESKQLERHETTIEELQQIVWKLLKKEKVDLDEVSFRVKPPKRAVVEKPLTKVKTIKDDEGNTVKLTVEKRWNEEKQETEEVIVDEKIVKQAVKSSKVRKEKLRV